LAAFGLLVLPGPNRAADEPKGKDDPAAKAEPPADPGPPLRDPKQRPAAPDLDGGVAWLNSGGPLSIKRDLKGKVVVLDFWTLCCINCIHILPDLHRLEKKYANELVVVGVHSPKFDNEKDTASIKKAVARYEIQHPVVNDADRKIWDRFGVDSWPSFVVIDPEGRLVGYVSGEGNYELLDAVVAKLVAEGKAAKTLNETPLRFDLAKFRERPDTPLFFPGKVAVDPAGNRLAVADSTHHRVVVTDLDGNHLMTAGAGQPGFQDGPFDAARFDDPQGMAFAGDTLYVADRKNHSIRALDLKARTVKTVAGNGKQEGDPNTRRLAKPVPATSIGLNSPWDLLLADGKLYIAMAGHHQLWVLDPKTNEVVPFAGNGRENIGDGPPGSAMFAQPSGLASDGKFLYVADSEISALRRVPLAGGPVETLVGRGLFVFGDVDGPGRVEAAADRDGKEARLQHALGVAWAGGKLYVADTYNSKIKVYDPAAGTLSTFLGGGEAGGWLTGPAFSEPAGLAAANGKLYVADTNAHRIRVVDLATKQVSTLKLKGVEPPKGEKK
ncbi:MAG: redoxin domain-containing protein, partial [Gemmataceae bacterium]|nr:redoxin domain-containing protein [Gemmataceae bacterium]